MYQHNKNKKLHVVGLKTDDEIEDAKFFMRHHQNGKRDELLFLFGINTGLRCSDIVTRTVGEVRTDDHPYVREQKTGKWRKLNLTNLRPKIDEYLAQGAFKDSDYLFQSRKGQNRHLTVNGVYQIMRRLGHEMGRDDLGTHTMRKTFGWAYYQKTKDIATLMEIFNHSSQAITKRYIGLTQDEIDKSLDNFAVGL
ncbi:phage integrase family protein [Lactobacillus selangorensis]|uniref:Phage integrase family protein n=1 Tax=Lactobacillus selangorensis TaxID=81857 RepID=A0A0R2FMR4_9LACO|nr:tyrosine-type recombinase/integrase [Lactobacillus selangorensis]KRN29470.1 phage integrase family protein [Lactobacillus selangorensis]KRN34001.1 phage integrase family protein [Lactobacillus selangorensis]